MEPKQPRERFMVSIASDTVRILVMADDARRTVRFQIASADGAWRTVLANGLTVRKHSWTLEENPVCPDPQLHRQVEFVANHIKQCGMNVPRTTDLVSEAAGQGIAEGTLDQILRHLVEKNEICFADGVYVHGSLVALCREKLLSALAERDEGMTVAEFRDLVAGNRKICLTLLALYDAEGITKRVGDRRVLASSG